MPSRRALLTAIGSAGTAALAGCSALEQPPEPVPDATPTGDDWPMGGFDAHNTRFNAEADPPTTAPDPRWTAELGWGLVPLVREDRVVLTDYGGLTALDRADGSVAWVAAEDTVCSHCTPALGADRVYHPGTECLRGYALADGTPTWEATACESVNTGSPTVAGGRVVLEHGGVLSAIDDTGRTTWAAPGDAERPPAVTEAAVYATAVFDLAAFDLTAPARAWPWENTDGEPPLASREDAVRWRYPGDHRPGVTVSTPAVGTERVFVAATGDVHGGASVVALDRETGERDWTFRAHGEVTRDPEPLVVDPRPGDDDGRVVAALGDGSVYGFTTYGRQLWRVYPDGSPTTLAGGGRTVCVAVHDLEADGEQVPGAIVAFDMRGTERWRIETDDAVRGLSVAGDTLFASVVTDRAADGDVLTTEVRAYAGD